MNLTNAKSYLKFLKSTTIKNVSLRTISRGTNIQEQFVLNDFSEFEPMIRMLDNINYKKFIDNLEKFIENKKVVVKKQPSKKKIKVENCSVKDFIYDRILLMGGFVDRNYEFTLEDLKKLRTLINREIKNKKD